MLKSRRPTISVVTVLPVLLVIIVLLVPLTSTSDAWGGASVRLATEVSVATILPGITPSIDPSAAPDPPPRKSLTWPLKPNPEISRNFDAPANPYGPGHRGLDLAARPGQEVFTSAAGVIIFAGILAGRGVVSIEHAHGLRTTYEPIATAVKSGDSVTQGQLIGTVTAGHPKCASATCLHWGLRRGELYLNPLLFMRNITQLRLKPWTG